MDINDVRSLVTLVSLLLFAALMAWTWWPGRRPAHDAAARLPFDGDAPQSIEKIQSRAERRAAPKPARIPSGDRAMYSSIEGHQ